MEPGTKAGVRNLFQKKGSSNKSHSCLLILPQAQPIFSGEGPRKDPLLSLGTDTHWVTCQYSFLFHVSHNPHLKKKMREKNPPPHSGHFLPQQVWGKMGYSTLGSGKNREQKKRLDGSSASWSGSVASAAAICCSKVCILPSRLSASLLPAHINQGSDGCKEVWAGRRRGLGAEVPKAPAPGGREGPMHGAVCLFFFWTGPAPDCPSLALLPLTCRVSVSRGSS